MTLATWLRNDWLLRQEVTVPEVRALLVLVDRDLGAAVLPGQPVDWRFNIAYSAVLQLATIALAAEGYRATRDQHHHRVLQSLRHTIGTDATLVKYLDKCRQKRNIAGYVSSGLISDAEANELLDVAHRLKAQVLEWLARNHPELRPGPAAYL